MADVTGYVRAAYQGMSQAPPQDRLREACRLMLNVYPAIPSGAQKRPPLEWLAKIVTGAGTDDGIWQSIPRGSPSEDITVLVTREADSTVVRLFKSGDQTPVAITSTSSSATAYLNAGDPSPVRDLRVFTIEDVTFITNRLRQVELSEDTAETRPFEALIWAKTGQYARVTSVTVSPSGGTPVTASYKPSTGGNAEDADGVGTDVIANALYSGTVPTGSGGNFTGTPLSDLGSQGFTVIRTGSLIYLSHPTVDFTIALSDDQGGQGVVAIKGSVQRFSDLPALARDGFTVRVAQEITGGNSDYYVQFVADNSTNTGTWKEVIAPGAPLGLDPESMPVVLSKEGGNWTLTHPDWGQRTTGTALLSPDPQFIGDFIKTVRWFGGRLLLIFGGGAILSASDDPYKFYTTTLATALKSDAIERVSPINAKVFFEDAEVFTDVADSARALVFADQGQAILRVQGPVATSETVSFEQFGQADYSPLIPLQATASNLYFGSFRPNSAAIYELAPDRISGQTIPEDMTMQIPRLLPTDLDRGCTLKADYVTVRGTSGAQTLWVHVYRKVKGESIQNSWSYWNLPEGFALAGMYMEGSIMHLLMIDGALDLHWCRMQIVAANIDQGGTILQHLDFRVTEQEASLLYRPIEDTSEFTLPFPVTDDVVASVRGIQGPTADYPEGYLPEVLDVDVDDANILLKGDWRDRALWFGYNYRSEMVPSILYKYGQDGAPEQNGKLTIKKLVVDLARTGYLRFETYLKGKGRSAPYVTVYEGYRQDDTGTPIDNPPGDDESAVALEVSIGSNNKAFETHIINDSHLGFLMVGFEYLAQWAGKGRRIT